MDSRYVIVGREVLLLIAMAGDDLVHMAVVHLNPRHLFIGENQPLMAADDVAQQIGEPSASSLKPACPLNVEHHEDGMHIGRCPVAHTSIERAKIGKDRLQPFVVGEAADESIGRHEKILRMGKQAHLLRATEMENIDMPGHLIDGIDILFQVLFFLWEISSKRVDESLPGVSDFKY